MKSEVTSLEELFETTTPPGERLGEKGRVRKAIVTGGDTGIGRYTAIALAKDGCDVAFTYAHHPEDAELTAQAVRKLGRKAYVEKMDLTNPMAAISAVDSMVRQLGGLDIFVANAGKMIMKQFPELTLADMQDLFNVNTFGAVMGVQRAVRHMLNMDLNGNTSSLDEAATMAKKILSGEIANPRKTPGRIIIVTSVHEHILSPADTIYTMTKHALGGFIKCASYAVGGTNITVNGVRPGEIATPMNDEAPEEALETERPHIPGRRPGHPTEIASMIKYLAMDESQYINGASFDVDGGVSVGGAMAMKMYRKLA